jgi:hypothetical protein
MTRNFRTIAHITNVEVCQYLNKTNTFSGFDAVLKIFEKSLPPGIVHACPYSVSIFISVQQNFSVYSLQLFSINRELYQHMDLSLTLLQAFTYCRTECTRSKYGAMMTSMTTFSPWKFQSKNTQRVF